MKYFFHPSANYELNEAIDYYEECQRGLGVEFTLDKEILIIAVMQLNRKPTYWKNRTK